MRTLYSFIRILLISIRFELPYTKNLFNNEIFSTATEFSIEDYSFKKNQKKKVNLTSLNHFLEKKKNFLEKRKNGGYIKSRPKSHRHSNQKMLRRMYRNS